MDIGSTKTKGTHGSASWRSLDRLPVLYSGVHIEWGRCKVKMFVGLLKMEARHELFLLHGQQDFLQTCHTSCCQSVTDIRFHRTDGTKVFALCFLFKNGCERFQLNGISKFGAGS